MRKIVLVAAVFSLLCTEGFTQSKCFKDIKGKWDIAGEQNEGVSLEIIDSSTILLTYMGETKKLIDHTIDFSKSPIWFDFSAEDTSSVVKVKSLLEIINEGLIKWQLFVNEERANHFSSSKGELLYLKRANTNTVVATIK